MSSPSPHPYKKILVLLLWLGTWGFVESDLAIKALWPSILGLSSVLLLRRVIPGLLIGGSAGAILLNQGNPLKAFVAIFTDHLIPALQSGWNISVLLFTLMLGGFVALIEKGGGIQALLNRWIQKSGSIKQRVQWSAFALGILCFFDGLANSLLVGKTLSPFAKQAGVSKQKLSYIVDSTSAAVACVAVISTWIAYQLSMIREGFRLADVEEVNAFSQFFRSIPLNFYCWFTLALLAVVIARNWNIGPMREAELAMSGKPFTATQSPGNKDSSTTEGAWRAIVPLLVLIVGLLAGLYVDGAEGGIFPINPEKISTAFGAADAAKILVTVSAMACIVAFLINVRSIKDTDASEVFMNGVLNLFPPCLILVSVWILSSTLNQLEAAPVLSSLIKGNLPAPLFPAAVFMTGTLISFTTGTSWGTMGVLMPLAIPVALTVGGAGAESGLIPVTVAAVFSGAVFGDHCSPLSDTTIVSSIACDLDPLEHVRTQLPYALLAASLAAVVGFIPAGFGIPGWISLLVGGVIIGLLPRIVKPKLHPNAS
jgi:tetracycline resistance efflux pump